MPEQTLELASSRLAETRLTLETTRCELQALLDAQSVQGNDAETIRELARLERMSRIEGIVEGVWTVEAK